MERVQSVHLSSDTQHPIVISTSPATPSTIMGANSERRRAPRLVQEALK